MTIQPDARDAVTPHLEPGEALVWTDQPDRSVVFHKEDWFMVPFSLAWGGFATYALVQGFFKEPDTGTDASGPWVWIAGSILFLLLGQYLIWGRFVHARSLKKRTYYAITDRRVIAVQKGWTGSKVAQVFLRAASNPMIEHGFGKTGTIRFQKVDPNDEEAPSWRDLRLGDLPVLSDIAGVDGIHQLILELRERRRLPSMR